MLKIFNTLGRKKQEFKPIKKGQVSMYTCGPTVYQYAHIGNLRAYLAADILRRVLEYDGLKVCHIMNITDVGHLTSDADTGEDKVEQAARKAGKTAKEITKFYAERFVKDLHALNIEMPVKFAWASKYIKEQIDLINQLEKKGYIYKTSDGIYFDTAKFKDYGKLSKISTGKSRVAHSKEKKQETDFALWKFSRAGEKRQQEWKSPWGVGYPGWHIECSAISTKELGQPFDIHTGGEDHIATHHNNEIAQSEAAYGKPLAHYWLHNAFMVVTGAKMAKSAGNFLILKDLTHQGFNPLAFRYLAISSHYQQKLNFSQSALAGAQSALQNLQMVFSDKKFTNGKVVPEYRTRFTQAINDDLNMPQVMLVVWEVAKDDKISPADKQKTLSDFDRVLGLGLSTYKVPESVDEKRRRRKKAREKGDYKTSDKLKKEIEKSGLGVIVRDDTSTGTQVSASQWRRK